jgi:hypothetical protein
MKKFALLLLLLLSFCGIGKAQHFTTVWTVNGPSQMNFYVTAAAINGIALEAGDEIGVFDGSYCVAAGVLTGPIAGIFPMIAQEAMSSSSHDGYIIGHTASFQIWDNSSGAYVTSVSSSADPILFAAGGTAMVSLTGTLPLPDIAASSSSIYFGNVNVGSYSDLSVTISNAGTADLSITSTSITGSGAGSFSIQNGGAVTLAAGSTKVIAVRFSPSATGPIAATLSIASNDPDENPFGIDLSGIGVVPDISATPNPLAFGNINVGANSEQTLTINNTGTGTLNISSTAISGSGSFTIQSGSGSSSVPAGGTRSIVIRFSPTATGEVTGNLVLASNDPDSPTFNINLTGTGIAPEIAASPTSLDYGSVNIGSTSDMIVTISNSGSADLILTTTSIAGLNSSSFSITNGGGPATIASGASRDISIRFTPASTGAKTANLSIINNDSDEGTFTVSLSGTGIAPEIGASPSSLSFGNVTVGATSDLSVTINNTGSANLNISATSLTGSGSGNFSITGGGGAATITAGGSKSITLRFSPSATGAVLANLSIANNDPDENPFTVALSGTGVSPEINVSPTSYAFGSHEINSSATTTFTVTNQGSATLSVTNASLTGTNASEFAINSGGGSFTLAASASRSIVVAFNPTTAGSKTASLHIVSDDADEGTLDLALSGTGTVIPDIAVSSASANFGSVLIGAYAEATVTVSNTGTGMLSITGTSLTGSNTDQFSIQTGGGSTTLAPAGTRNIVLRFTPTATGAKSASLSIASDDPDENPVIVTLAGTGVDPEINISPVSADFGSMEIYSGSSTSFTISNTGNTNLIVSSTNLTGTDASEFSITSGGGNYSLAPLASRTLVIAFNPITTGPKSASIQVASNDRDENPLNVALTGTGIVIPDISASPNPANAGDIAVGNSADVIIIVSSNGTGALSVTSTSISGTNASMFTIQSGGGAQTIASGSSASIVVRFTPTSSGSKTAALNINSNDPDENPYSVTLYGNGLVPDISVSPTTWNYGNIIVGNTGSAIFNISNTGGTTLNVNSTSLTGGNASEFNILSGGGNYSLASTASRAVQVQFAPTSTGSKSTTLRISSNDPDESPFDVTLSGTCIPANTAPVVTIPDQTISEGSSFAIINLDNCVTDDNTSDANIGWSYAGNTSLSVSINSSDRTATISIPYSNWNGSETITFYATDNYSSPLTGYDVATFTVTAVNDAPVVSNIPDQAIADDGSFTSIHLDNYVSDVETPDASIVWTYAGNINLIVSIVNRVATIAPASGTWTGSETITFTATDNDPVNPLSASDIAKFTITNDNLAPVVSIIPDQIINEGASFATISLDNCVTDNQTSDANITWTFSGNTQLVVSIINRIATITAPNTNWYGSEIITFTATDDDAITPLSGSNAAVFTVNPVNDAPVISGQSTITTAEDQSLIIALAMLTVTDIDNSPGQLSVIVLPGENYTVTGVNTLTPATDYNGAMSVNLIVSDPADDSDPYVATVTVTPVNDQPIVSDIPDQSILVGANFLTIALNDYVSDVETVDNAIIWSFSGNSQLLVEISDQVATVSVPSESWIGSDTITFSATDDDLSNPLSNSDKATFTVNSINTAPVVIEIPDQTISFGNSFESIALNGYVEDSGTADEDIIWSISNSSVIGISIVDQVAYINILDDEWYGSETITFTATDNDLIPLSDNTDVVFSVNEPDALDNYIQDIDIRVYPNPTNGTVFIDFSDRIYTTMEIRTINTLGQIVNISDYKMVEKTVELDMSNLPGGIYHLEVISDNFKNSFSIMVE